MQSQVTLSKLKEEIREAKQKKIDKNRYWENLTINSTSSITNPTSSIITFSSEAITTSEKETSDSQKENENNESEPDNASDPVGDSNDAHGLDSETDQQANLTA